MKDTAAITTTTAMSDMSAMLTDYNSKTCQGFPKVQGYFYVIKWNSMFQRRVKSRPIEKEKRKCVEGVQTTQENRDKECHDYISTTRKVLPHPHLISS
jgi:hypothetical protein